MLFFHSFSLTGWLVDWCGTQPVCVCDHGMRRPTRLRRRQRRHSWLGAMTKTRRLESVCLFPRPFCYDRLCVRLFFALLLLLRRRRRHRLLRNCRTAAATAFRVMMMMMPRIFFVLSFPPMRQCAFIHRLEPKRNKMKKEEKNNKIGKKKKKKKKRNVMWCASHRIASPPLHVITFLVRECSSGSSWARSGFSCFMTWNFPVSLSLSLSHTHTRRQSSIMTMSSSSSSFLRVFKKCFIVDCRIWKLLLLLSRWQSGGGWVHPHLTKWQLSWAVASKDLFSPFSASSSWALCCCCCWCFARGCCGGKEKLKEKKEEEEEAAGCSRFSPETDSRNATKKKKTPKGSARCSLMTHRGTEPWNKKERGWKKTRERRHIFSPLLFFIILCWCRCRCRCGSNAVIITWCYIMLLSLLLLLFVYCRYCCCCCCW